MNHQGKLDAGYKYEHLIVLPVPFLKVGDELYIEAQAHQGAKRWLENFENLALAAPVIPKRLAQKRKEMRWLPLCELAANVHIEGLPWAYRPDQFMRKLRWTIPILTRLVKQSRYLQFAISGLWGDWAAVAAEIAICQERMFAVHTDNVAHVFMNSLISDRRFLKKMQVRMNALLVRHWHKRIISRCHLGLFHGMDTYAVYSMWMKNIKEGRGNICCIHDIHDGEGLDGNIDHYKEEKVINQEDREMHVLYAGRFAPEKAPLDWVQTISILNKRNFKFHAVWAGDGPLYQDFMRALQLLDLNDSVEVPGFISERRVVGGLYRQADIFLFTHITPESPRCLLEALRFGVPIVGYESAYAKDLISQHGGGVLVRVGDWQALADAVTNLFSNRIYLAELQDRALKDGERFTSHNVFSERSELIKRYLS